MRWYLAAVFLLAVGLVFQLGLLVYAMYALLGVMLVSRYLARSWSESLTAVRESNKQSAEIGETVAVIVTVKNIGGLPVVWVLLEDSLPRDALSQRPPRIKVKQRRTAIAQLRPGKSFSMRYQVTFQMRGYYQIGPLLAETGDVFGLHRRYRVLTEPQYVLVLPKVLPLLGYDIASKRPIGEVRMQHRLFEDPTRISGVRPYERGDALNRIHWKATARTGELHSKTFEPSTIAGATFLLDFHRDRYTERGEPHRSELAITTVASLMNAVYLLGQQIGFFSNGRDAVDRIRQEGFRHDFRSRLAAKKNVGMADRNDRMRPVEVRTQRGVEQFQRILEALARLELTDGLTFPQLVTEVGGHMPRDATVVAVLPECPSETAIALGNLRRNGYAVTAVLTMYDDETAFPLSAGRLMAENIDVRRVDSEQAISALCTERLV